MCAADALALQWVHPQSKGIPVSLTRFDFVNILLIVVLWVLFVMLCGVVTQKWHNFKVGQCYKHNVDAERYACMRKT